MALISIFRRPILSAACYGRAGAEEGARGEGSAWRAMRKRQSARRAGAPGGDGDGDVAVAVAVAGGGGRHSRGVRGGRRVVVDVDE